jgi:hypothetical protein
MDGGEGARERFLSARSSPEAHPLRVCDVRIREAAVDFKLEAGAAPAGMVDALHAEYPTLRHHHCVGAADARGRAGPQGRSADARDRTGTRGRSTAAAAAPPPTADVIAQDELAHLFEHLVIDILAADHLAECGTHKSFAGYTVCLDGKNKIMRVTISCADPLKCLDAADRAIASMERARKDYVDVTHDPE